MNIRSAELLNQSLQNAADNIYRNRALAATVQEEAQRNAVEQSFRNAMMQHYANIEEKQAESAALQEQRLENEDNAVEKKYGVMQALADQKDAQDRVMQGLQGLSLDQKLAPAQKTQYLRQSIDAMQPQGKAAFLQNPQINALYQGNGDWDAVAQMVGQYRAGIGKMGKAGGQNNGVKPPSDTAEIEKQTSQAPQQLADTVAQSDPNVPKDPSTGKPAVPVLVNPADAQRFGMMAGDLRARGYPSPLAAAEGLVFGTNATVSPNVATNVPASTDWRRNSVPAQISTNSFMLTPGGVNQDAVADIAGSPDGTNFLGQFGIPLPGQPAAQAQSAQLKGTVRVKRPDGTTGTIPSANLNAALQQGYSLMNQ